MRVPAFIPLAVPNITEDEVQAVLAAVRSGWVSTSGPDVKAFEENLAATTGAVDAVAVAAGTMGLHLALVALGVGVGDAVLTAGYTFAATANAICHAGAEPIFLDIRASDWTLSPDAVEAYLAEKCERVGDRLVIRDLGLRVGAIMPVYTNGHPADMDRFSAIGRAWGVPIVADAAAAIGARYKGRDLAGLAELTVFSFNGNKTITSGGGGAVVSTDAALAARVRHLATTARVGADYDHDVVGFNYRITNLEAALGNAQLKRLGDFVARKREIHRAYSEGFADLGGFGAFPLAEDVESAHWFAGIVIPEDVSWCVGDLISGLNARQIGVRSFWKPMQHQGSFASRPARAHDGPLVETERLWRRVLPLPCSTSLTDEDLVYVIATVREVVGELSRRVTAPA